MHKSAGNPGVNANWAPAHPYNELPLLPPAGELETTQVLKCCIEARAALAELKQAAELIPNQAILINTLPLLEAQSSSEIENIITTTDRLFQHRATDDHADPATKEALRYSQALLEGYRSLAACPLTTRTAEQICSQIKGREIKVRKVPGTKLAKQGGEVVYTPPDGEPLLRELLSNWEKFMHQETRFDPLVRLAVGHYQFEAIHPFTDGNGRTGRILNSLFLIGEGLLTLPILYLSRYIIQHHEDYYRLLREVTRDANWQDWINYVVRGVEETSKWTTEKMKSIRTLAEHTAEYIRSREPRVYSYELVNVIFERPYCRIQDLVDANISERRAASRYLKALVGLGVLQEHPAGREKLFIHLKFLKLLTKDSNEFERYLPAGSI